MLSHLWSCIRGPAVYRIYTPSSNEQSKIYPSNPLEHGSNQVVKTVMVFLNIGLYASPIILLYLWRHEFRFIDVTGLSAKAAVGLSLIILTSIALRGIGRAFNPAYAAFLKTLNESNLEHANRNLSYSLIASKYDCEFSALPVTFASSAVMARAPSLYKYYLTFSGLAASLFGRHLIYPGSVTLLKIALGNYLDDGRTTQIVKHKGRRAKVQTSDGNFIDTMFIDRRNGSYPGDMLVICCEGNAGFYEIGITTTPISAGYSVLGWNTPGFAYSTGLPFPDQIQNAADAVMQFAIEVLGYSTDNILIYGWSIGGYPATWLAKTYPEVRGVVLDATFDHVLPLAIPRMPAFMSGLVKSTIREHFNLNNAQQILDYSGPVTIVRRTEDEIITIVDGQIGSNRGNALLEVILKHRYPYLISNKSRVALRQYWHCSTEAQKAKVLSSYGVNEQTSLAVLAEGRTDPPFPSAAGQNRSEEVNTGVLLFLATKMLVDMEGGHGNPLSTPLFKTPWSLVVEDSFVQID